MDGDHPCVTKNNFLPSSEATFSWNVSVAPDDKGPLRKLFSGDPFPPEWDRTKCPTPSSLTFPVVVGVHHGGSEPLPGSRQESTFDRKQRTEKTGEYATRWTDRSTDRPPLWSFMKYEILFVP